MAAAAELKISLIGQNLLGNMFRGARADLSGLASAITLPTRGIALLGSGLGALAGAPLKAVSALASGLTTIGLAGLGVAALADTARGLSGALGLGLASEMENTRAQFLAMTKDGALTDRMLASFQTRADKTPFALKEIASAAASLLPAAKQGNLGLEGLLDTAQLLAVLNPAEGLSGAAFSLREALSGDFVSVIERFNLSRDALKKLKAQGVPAVQAINTVLKSMGIDASLVAAMGETLTGRWSTFKDTIDGLRRTLATPLLEGLKAGLISLQGVLDANKPALTEWARTAGEALGSLTGKVVAGIPHMVDSIRTLVGAMSGTWKPAPGIDAFHETVGKLGLGLAFARDAVSTFVGALSGTWAGDAASGINPVHLAIGNLGNSIRTVVLPALERFGAWFLKTGGPAIRDFADWFSVTIMPTLTDFASMLVTDVLPKVMDFGAWLIGEGLKAVKAFGEWFKTDGVPLLDAFKGAAAKVGDLIKDVVGPAFVVLSGNAGEIFKQVTPLVTSFGDLLTAIKPIGQAIGLAFGAIAALIPSQIKLLTGFVEILSGTFRLVGSLVSGIIGAFTALAKGDNAAALAAITAAFGEFKAAGDQVAKGVATIGGAVGDAAGLAAGALGIGFGTVSPGVMPGVTQRPPVMIGPPAPTPAELDARQRNLDQLDRHTSILERSAAAHERIIAATKGLPTDISNSLAGAFAGL